jgi:hypothetical protein
VKRQTICLDTETTGLDPRIHVPVEVGWEVLDIASETDGGQA